MIGFNLGRAEEKEVELARLVEEVNEGALRQASGKINEGELDHQLTCYTAGEKLFSSSSSTT